MCRFLLVRSKSDFNPYNILTDFALMCQKSHAPDGDWQGDGWGIAWYDKGFWKSIKSLSPIWEEQNKLLTIPQAKLFAVHARSAGFPQHKHNFDFNQPYLGDNLCFVFNGMIRGVQVPRNLDGQIGAQKIFSFLRQEIKNYNPHQSLSNLDKTIINNSRLVEGMNVGIVANKVFYILCEYSRHPSYFSLHYFQSNELILVCSEKISNYLWKTMAKGEIKVL